jgi:hypothetical protein
MSDMSGIFHKNGTTQQHRATVFDKTPASGTSLCPFKSPDVAIVPLRYALDRSRHDTNCTILKPLAAAGTWADLPVLKTRGYTLRQLYDGYVYVFDETAGTFHEYAVNGSDATLARIVWTDAHLGKDTRGGANDPRPYLLYPRTHRLHLGFSSRQWSWRVCEHMRSNADSRARWMKPLDLEGYCVSMAEPGTLPLAKLAEAVADIDRQQVSQDDRFADSWASTQAPAPDPQQSGTHGEAHCSPVGADVHWLGSVPDKDSALLIALDDPLAIFADLGLQLAADQAALRVWQGQHEHKAGIASVVTNMCASSDDPDRLPAAVKHDVARTQRYLSEVDAYLESRLMEENEYMASSVRGDSLVTPGRLPSDSLGEALQARYNKLPSAEDYASWKARAKWQREVDVEGARAYIAQHKPEGDQLLRAVRDTQADFIQWAEYVGVEPGALFIDTAHPGSLLYLQSIMSDLLVIFAQSVEVHDWLIRQEDTATTLFGTMRYGFSAGLKDALHKDADQLLNGLNDYTNLATRVGELNSLLNHPAVANSTWMNLLKQAVRETFTALTELAAGEGKSIAETILTSWMPMDSQRVKGAHQNLTALLRTIMIGQVLANSPHRLAIDAEIGNRLKTWKLEKRVLDKNFRDLQRNWRYPTTSGPDRRNLSRQLQKLNDTIRLHHLQIPRLLDFQDRQYAQLIDNEARRFLQSGLPLEHWQTMAKDWFARQLSNGAAGVTWGVIMFNFISTAFLYADLTRDGDFSERDILKISYGLAYTGNLLMGVYVAAPWAIVRAAQPVLIERKMVSILERSASHWASRGNMQWAKAVRGFRVGMVAMGAFGVIGASLELIDLFKDHESAGTQIEKNLIRVKMFAVVVMWLGSFAALVAGIFPASFATAVAASPWTLGLMLVVGIAYLFITMFLNHLKQDSIGLWLRKCCWSSSPECRYPETPEGIAEEQRHFQELVLSPAVLVKQTFHHENQWAGKDGHVRVKVQDGAWIQILLSQSLRGRSIDFNVISSERSWNALSVEKSDKPIVDRFLDTGWFTTAASFGSVDNERPSQVKNDLYFPPVPPKDEDVVWQTWVPLGKEADFIELQIWYPRDIVVPGAEDRGYLYQIELSDDGVDSVDGLLPTQLEVKASTRTGASILETPE